MANATEFTNPKIGAIKRAINAHISPSTGRSTGYMVYSNWYIGVTNNPAIRKIQHENEKDLKAIYFKEWDADTLNNALAIEKYFHEQGMQLKHNAGGVRKTTTYVYVFKYRANLLDYIAHILGIVKT